eukprot:TRINITY_DN34349_c0_g1_i1.p1 TRINITY_DN34349_c0_g1~~TRINITY_DN34349_c0_g1_i1.p1  ORF type:complete len:254 (-),score=32.03 TRINITY_DN34349_c0_g1_i1:29-790(-)
MSFSLVLPLLRTQERSIELAVPHTPTQHRKEWKKRRGYSPPPSQGQQGGEKRGGLCALVQVRTRATFHSMKNRKVAVLGFRAVGKSAVVIQFVEDHFVESYLPTIENTFRKVIKYRGVEYQTDIVDTAGQDEYSIFHTQYSIGVHGYVLVYSVVSRLSFEMTKTINEKLLNVLGTDKVPRVLVGNKVDLAPADRQVSFEEGEALAAKWGCAFVECSAKNNDNVDKAFFKVVDEIERLTTTPEDQVNNTCCAIL